MSDSSSNLGCTLTCSLCGSIYKASEPPRRGGLAFCPACLYDRQADCLALMKGGRGKPVLIGLVVTMVLCGGAFFLLAGRFGYDVRSWKFLAASPASPPALQSTSAPVAANSPAKADVPAPKENTAAAKVATTPNTLRSVVDVGNIHLLYVTAPGTDACLGIASRLYVTREAPSNEPARLVTKVGDDMTGSFQEGLRYVQKQPRDWEKQFSVRLSFEDRDVPKDGGSAGTAFTVAMLAAIKGVSLDPDVAITGDLTVDGSVRPVGGVVEKVRGAIADHCKVTLIPERNTRDIVDMALLDGSSPLWETQVFTINTVDDALSLARPDRPANVKAAIARFNQLRARLPAVVTPNYLPSPIVQSELKEILRLAPNHLTAATLLRAATNQLPPELSLNRSVETILGASYLFVASVISPEEKEDKSKTHTKPGITIFPEREFEQCSRKLQNFTPILDKRSIPLKAACLEYGGALREALSYKSKYPQGTETNRELRELALKEAASIREVKSNLDTARSDLLLALRKLRTDGDLTAEMLYK